MRFLTAIIALLLGLAGCSEAPGRRGAGDTGRADAPADGGRRLYSEAGPGFAPAEAVPLQAVTAPGMVSPTRLALAADGNLAVSDPRAKAVFVFSPGGRLVERINLLTRPLGVAVDAVGRYILGDADGSRITIRSPGAPMPRLFCVEAGEFKKANDIAIDAVSGLVWIADSGNHRVVACTSEGVFVRAFGARGPNPGDFDYPIGIAVAPAAGEIYVSDQQNGRVQVFDEFGIFKRAVASYGGADGQLARPAGLALDGFNRLYVADLFQSRVQAFDPAGGHLQWLGAPGDEPGKLLLPNDLVVDRHNRLIVASQMTRRLEYLGLDGYSNPVDPAVPLEAAATLLDPVIAFGPRIAPSYLCLDVPASASAIVASSIRVGGRFAVDVDTPLEADAKCGPDGRYYESMARIALAELWVDHPKGGPLELPVEGRLRDGSVFAGTLSVTLVGGEP